MFNVVGNSAVVIFTIGVIIFVHELGHFLLARFNKVDVLEFAIGFGPRLISWNRGGTRYSIRAIPFGGFVRMSGDDRFLVAELAEREKKGGDVTQPSSQNGQPTTTSASEQLEGREEEIQALLAAPEGWFLSKGYLAKSSIVVAGPLFNIVFALFLAIVSFSVFGEAVLEEGPVIGDVQLGHPAEKAGIKPGDRVVSIDGALMQSWKQLAATIRGSDGKELELVITRKDGGSADAPASPIALRVQPVAVSGDLEVVTGAPAKGYVIGISPSYSYQPMPFDKSVLSSCRQVWHLSVLTARSLWWFISGKLSSKHIGGPIQMFQETSRSAKRGGGSLLGVMIYINIMLAVVNLLPIPILDGGHLLLFTFEAIKGSAVSVVTYQRLATVGTLLILGLMALGVTNDLGRVLGFH